MAESTKRYVAVDLGTTGGKVVLASVTAGTVTTETVHSFSIPVLRMGGLSYWDIYAAYSEVLKGLSSIGSRGLAVESVGIDAWGPGLVCVAKDGKFLGLPRLAAEVLSESVQAKFFKRMDKRELYEGTGVNVLDSHAALQLFGLRRAKSVALDDAKYLLFIPEAIAYLLADKRFTGFSSLSSAGLMDRRTRKISRDVLSACKVRPRRFPSVVLPGVKTGKLTEDVAQATGLGRIPVVAVAGHDLASAAVALSAIYPPAQSSDSSAQSAPVPDPRSSQPGASAFLRIGSVSELGVGTASPVVNDQTFEMNFSNEASADGTNLLVGRIVGTDLLERCVAAWRAAGRDYGPEDLARMAREGAPVAAQLDPEDPALRSAFAALSFDPAAALSRYCSLRSMTAPADDASIVRLILTSMAEKFGDTFVKLQSVTPFRLKSLCLIGSLHSGPLGEVFCQMVADECAVPVQTGPEDAAVIGNVLVQAGGAQAGSCQSALARSALAALSSPAVTYTPGL